MKRTDEGDVPCLLNPMHNQSYKMNLMIQAHVDGSILHQHGPDNDDCRACCDFLLFKWSRNE